MIWLERFQSVMIVMGLGLLASCTSQPHVVESRVIHPFEDVTVRLDEHVVELKSWSCLDGGWLEQVACSANTREHESLLVVKAKPSQLHAALLLAEFEPGRPGSWTNQNDQIQFVAPTGTSLDVSVRYVLHGETIEHPVRHWIQGHRGRHEFPAKPWVFSGSLFETNPKYMGPGEHYVADQTGSIIGLVTFGDEVIGFSEVIADEASVQQPEWEVAYDSIPPLGTVVTIVIRRFEEK